MGDKTMWKAVLVLFITSDAAPMSMMMGQFPQVFATETTCKTFVESKRSDIGGAIAAVGKVGKLEIEVVRHMISCVEDDSGDPI